jgi:hypothetical protein
MTKKQIGLAGLLVAAIFIVQYNVRARQTMAAREPANISLNFPAIPVEEVFSVYASFAKEKLRVPLNLRLHATVRIIISHRVTRTEALKMLEAALLEQAHITIRRAADGTLEGVPKQEMRTYLPNGQVDPPYAQPGLLPARPSVMPRLAPPASNSPP